jgi:hypothetical protein
MDIMSQLWCETVMLDRVTGMQVFVHQHEPLSLAAALAAPRKFPDAKPLQAQLLIPAAAVR